ncbi:MAG: transposase [Cyanobacteria bacterium REEB65]|nr:transposase [Cyanobacteria bacterium REEB65]
MSRANQSRSRAEKARIIAEVQRRHRVGAGSYKFIAGQFGISEQTYYNWVRKLVGTAGPTSRATPAKAEVAVMRPVELTAIMPAPSQVPGQTPDLTLSAPGGYRVEGLTVESVAALLRALR